MAQLLAPGGSVEMACTAVDEGADIIYVGPLGYSRRPYESELTDAEIREVTDYASAHGREVRVVLNTYPSPFEMEAFLAKAKGYADNGVSGFVVTDGGALRALRQLIPDTFLHVSIGSGISNSYDADFYRSLGADVIILPYRWDVAEIAQTRQTSDIGLEVFLFETVQTGKICPGKCIMSSYLKFREWQAIEGQRAFNGSANRGAKECYRVCQTHWSFGPENKSPENTGTDDPQPQQLKLRRDAYLMLDQLPAFIERGVQFFKLSGRERPTEMITDLVRFYRRVIDGIQDDGQTDMAPYRPELEVLRQRWIKAKSRRVGTLMSRAKGYGETSVSTRSAGHG